MRRALLLLLVEALAGAGCRHGAEPGLQPRGPASYGLGPLGPGWSRVKAGEADLVYADGAGRALAVSSTCGEAEDVPLEALTRHLLFGFTDRQELSQERLTLDGREALRTRLRARLDGAPTELLLVVLKKDGCVYDFSYVTPPGRFEERVADFDALVGGFHAERPL